MPGNRSTLQHIAEDAGVSVATVSNVLNGKGRMSDDLRRRVGRMLRDRGVRPRLKRRRILYLTDQRMFQNLVMTSPFMAKFQGLSHGLNERDLQIDLQFIDTDRDVSPRAIAPLVERRPGMVVLDTDLHDAVDRLAQLFAREQVPSIQVGHVVRSPQCDAVVIDDFEGARLATRYLIQQGHERVGTLRWNVAGDPASASKHAGYLAALAEVGREADPSLIVEAPYKRTAQRLTGRTGLNELLDQADPPTAVFVENSFVSPSLVYPNSMQDQRFDQQVRALEMVHFEAQHLDIMEQVLAGMLQFPSRDAQVLRVDWEAVGGVAADRVLQRLVEPEGPPAVVKVAARLYRLKGMQVTPLPIDALD